MAGRKGPAPRPAKSNKPRVAPKQRPPDAVIGMIARKKGK